MANTQQPGYEPEEDLPVYFWKPDEEHGWASQWYHSPFTARVTLPSGEEREALFPTAEHWMMAQKALLFGDLVVFERIVPSAADPPSSVCTATIVSEPSTSTPTSRTRSHKPATHVLSPTVRSRPRPHHAPKPREVKALGRKVQGFDDAIWARAREYIVLSGTLYKFRQHAGLRAALLATGTRELVEASPKDRVWRIGFGKAEAERVDREMWGMNLLGRALMEARTVLRREAEDARAGRPDGDRCLGS